MFFSAPVQSGLRRPLTPSTRSLERFMAETGLASRQSPCAVTQDEASFTLSFDVPGVTKDQLSVGVEGNVVRIETKQEATRQYRWAYELPQDIDTATSQASLENGVLTLKLGKLQPVNNITQLIIN